MGGCEKNCAIYPVSDGIGTRVVGLQNNTDEVRERLDELGIEDAGSRQIVIDAILELNCRCDAVCKTPPHAVIVDTGFSYSTVYIQTGFSTRK